MSERVNERVREILAVVEDTNTPFEKRLLRALDMLGGTPKQSKPRPEPIIIPTSVAAPPVQKPEPIPAQERVPVVMSWENDDKIAACSPLRPQAKNVLKSIGITEWPQLADHDLNELLKLRGIGESGWRCIRSEVDRRNIKLSMRYVKESYRGAAVYFIRGGDSIKIGISDSPGSRIASLKTSSPIALEIIGVIYVGDRDAATKRERELHEVFAAHRTHGEWFSVAEAITDYIAQHAETWNPLREWKAS